MKILVVDDEAWMRRTLNAMLTNWGYDVIEAGDGDEAWSLMERESPGMVIADWVMPRMSGLDLCRRLRATDLPHYIYFILLTGQDQVEDTFTAFDAGVDDFSNKPINAKALRVRIKAGERILRLEQALKASNTQLHQLNEALKSSQARIQDDLEAAADVQRSLLPTCAQTGLPVKLAWAMVPAEELAGDIFNFFKLDEQCLGFYLIDVSGHGVRAAMVSVHLARLLSPQSPLHSLHHLNPFASASRGALTSTRPESALTAASLGSFMDPVEVVTHLNQGFQIHDQGMIYFTMIYGVLNTNTGVGSLCQAGHPYPLLCRRDGHVEILGEGGLPVGLVPEAHYEPIDLKIEQGDRLLLYSDGVSECLAPDGSAFGLERLSEALRVTRGDSLDAAILKLKGELKRWHTAAPEATGRFSDDISILSIELEKG